MLAKKILSLLLVMLMALPASVALAATDTLDSVSVNNRERKVVISGTSIQPDGTPVAVSVWYPLAQASDVGGDKALKEINAYTNQTTVRNGAYELTFYLKPDDTSGQYTALVFIPGMDAPLSKSFPYSDEVKRDALIAAIQNTANGETEIKLALNQNISAVNVAAGISYDAYSDEQKVYVTKYVAENRPQEELVEDAAATLSITLQKVVTALDTVAILANGSREDIKSFIDAEATDKKLQIDALAAAEMEEVLTAYDALSDAEKAKAVVAFEKVAEELVTPEEVIDALEFAIEEAQKPEEESQNSTPGGGNSGSGGRKNSSSSIYLPNDGTSGINPEATEAVIDEFTDLETVLWAKNAINILAARSIVSGKGNGLFCPDEVVTREEFVKLLVGALEIYTFTESMLPFNDVAYGAWYYEPIAIAHDLGLIEGISEDTFGVGEPIKRQDMAVLLQRVLTSQKITLAQGEEITFADEEQIAEYALSSVKALSANGILNGREDGSFDPEATASRAEAAAIIYRVMYKMNLL